MLFIIECAAGGIAFSSLIVGNVFLILTSLSDTRNFVSVILENNKEYKRTISKGTFLKGRIYLVAYDSKSFSLGTLFDIDITDSLYQYPKNGWTLKEIPFKVDTVYIKKKINEL